MAHPSANKKDVDFSKDSNFGPNKRKCFFEVGDTSRTDSKRRHVLKSFGRIFGKRHAVLSGTSFLLGSKYFCGVKRFPAQHVEGGL